MIGWLTRCSRNANQGLRLGEMHARRASSQISNRRAFAQPTPDRLPR